MLIDNAVSWGDFALAEAAVLDSMNVPYKWQFFKHIKYKLYVIYVYILKPYETLYSKFS